MRADPPRTSRFPWRLGRYEVLCELAHGGMAILYLARAVGPGGFERLFAIKMIHEHLGREPRFVQMFLDEARLVAKIRHPNVVPVYEIGLHEGRHFICMEYLSGETLGAALTSSWPLGHPFPLTLVPYVISGAAEGLHAAHELHGANGESLGVIHRDVSPQNIMLSYDGSIRVMDFGVAKARDQLAHSLPGTFKGTPAYMAPEQVRGLEMDRRSDVFALGVVLWEMTVGKRLFKGKNDLATTMNVLKKDIPPPTRMLDGYPALLEQIVMKALSRAPGERYGTARELSEALHQFELSLGVRTTAGDLEKWMRATFDDRLKERRAFERRAMDTLDLAPLVLPPELSVVVDVLPVSDLELGDEELIQERLDQAPNNTTLDGMIRSSADGLEVTRTPLPPRRWPWGLAMAAVAIAGVTAAVTLGSQAPDPDPLPQALEGAPVGTNPHRLPPGQAETATVPRPSPPPTSTPVVDRGQDPPPVRRSNPPQRRPRTSEKTEKWAEDKELYRGSDL